MDDRNIIELFFARDEKALSESQAKYGRYCSAVSKNILGNDEDAEEVLNDTLLRAWNSIPPEKPCSLKGYLASLCRNLACNRYKAKNTQKRGEPELALDELGECLPDQSSTNLAERFTLRVAIESFLRSLDRRDRIIFLQRYFYNCPIRDIAKRHGMKESAVTMLLFRTRSKLKDELTKEGINL